MPQLRVHSVKILCLQSWEYAGCCVLWATLPSQSVSNAQPVYTQEQLSFGSQLVKNSAGTCILNVTWCSGSWINAVTWNLNILSWLDGEKAQIILLKAGIVCDQNEWLWVFSLMWHLPPSWLHESPSTSPSSSSSRALSLWGRLQPPSYHQ